MSRLFSCAVLAACAVGLALFAQTADADVYPDMSYCASQDYKYGGSYWIYNWCRFPNNPRDSRWAAWSPIYFTGLTHTQNLGDRALYNGYWSGTHSDTLRMEALQLDWAAAPQWNGIINDMSIQVTCHVQNIGDVTVGAGQLCGTRGQGLRLEGVQIRLLGKHARKFWIETVCKDQQNSLMSRRNLYEGETAIERDHFCGSRGRGVALAAVKVFIYPVTLPWQPLYTPGMVADARILDANTFSWTYYRDVNADLLNAFGPTNTAAYNNHFLTNGIYEKRASHPTFNIGTYLAKNPSINTEFAGDVVSSTLHYIYTGRAAGLAAI